MSQDKFIRVVLGPDSFRIGLFGFEKEKRIAIVINGMDRSVVFMRADLLRLTKE